MTPVMVQARESGSTLPLVVETKLWPPLVREEALPRGSLVERLHASVAAHAVTLLSAGAGYGKTWLLAGWYASVPVPETVAWVTVDPADNDPIRLWRHVGESLRRTYRERLDRAAEPLGSSPAMVIATLVNELVATRAPRVLVLDDLHIISNQACFDELDRFIAAMPPKVRVVISSRADPPISLPLLRARRALGELRARHLACTRDEAEELARRMPGVQLRARDVRKLWKRTEGWPAGLYLAFLALADSADARAFVARFAGDTHTIADYLVGEVLGRLDEETRSFLVATSILDELSGPLCDATLATSGSAERLRALEQANLFVVPLDQRREWFRYHQLFRDLLHLELARLDPARRTELHRRAAGWYAATGARPGRAIEHCFSAGEPRRAARLLQRHAIAAGRAGHWAALLARIDRLPVDAVIRWPLLPAVAAVAATLLDAPREDVDRWLTLYEDSVGHHPCDCSVDAEVLATFTRAAFLGTDIGAAVEAGNHLCELDTRTTLHTGAVAHGTLAWALYLAGDLAAAEREAKTALEHERDRTWPGGTLQGRAVLSLLAGEAGDDRRALELARQAADAAAAIDVRDTAITVRARVAIALATAASARLDAAERDAAHAVGALTVTRDASRVHALIALASIRRRRGRLAAARDALDEGGRTLRGFADAGRLPAMLAEQRRLLAEAAAATAGSEALSDAELPVLRLLATGMSRREIATDLFLSPNTVKTHCHAIYRKLEVGSRADAVARARTIGLLGPDSPG